VQVASLIMSRDVTEVRPRVFVSYRRSDTRHAAGRLADMLGQDFDLFMDVEDIVPGTDFTQALRRAVDASQVMLALIGPDWATERNESGQRRIDDPEDWVAHEIAVGLHRNIVVIPVLIDGARMPDREELPPQLADLANRHAFRLRHESFADDAHRLRRAIHQVIGTAPDNIPEPEPPARPALPTQPPAGPASWAAPLEPSSDQQPPRRRRRGVLAIIVMLMLATIIGGAAIVIYQLRVLRPGETVTFETNRVTVREISYDPAYGYLVAAEVCVRKPMGNAPTNRLTWRAWTVVNDNEQAFTPSLVNDQVEPPGMYPRDGRYAVGQCASGVIPFAGLPADSKITQVIYQGSTNSATWRP
jgi:hypothetical protein